MEGRCPPNCSLGFTYVIARSECDEAIHAKSFITPSNDRSAKASLSPTQLVNTSCFRLTAGFSRQHATSGSSDCNYIIHMKSLAIPILCFSLLTTNTFAVSLTPPQVYAVKEDRSMASNVDTSETSTSTKILITTLSAGITFSGLMFLLIGSTQLGNENYNQSDAKRSVGVGAGMTVLGTFGIIGTWAF